jgi:monoterpene epsilon-lactone hydrolase
MSWRSQFPPRPGYPAPDSLVTTRAAVETHFRAQASDEPSGDRHRGESAEIAGVSCIDVGAPGSADAETPGSAGTTILYLYGGGFRMGSALGSQPFAVRLAGATGMRVVVPNYPLAPEHPYPAALTAILGVYEALLPAPGAPLVVVGDSAGGGLAASLTLAALRFGLRLPAAVALLSPWLDLTLTSPTFRSRAAADELFSHAAAAEAARMYLQGVPGTDEFVSPVHAGLTGFPPTSIQVGTDEVLLGDSLAFASALALANCEVSLRVVPWMQHIWPARQPELPESRGALAALAGFVNQHVR